MHANVPQFIDIEDKIAFGLTGRQLLWMGGAVAFLVLSYGILDRALFFPVGFFILVIFGAFAFWRPQGLSLITFSAFTLQYFLKPKNYIWKRVYRAGAIDFKKAALAQKKNLPPPAAKKKLPGESQLKRIAWELDTKR